MRESSKHVGLPQEWIQKKRDGGTLSLDEIRAFVAGVTSGSVSEAQIAAFSMAVYFQDLSVDERVGMTLAVRDSGRVLSWQAADLPGPIVDKHSTGGVGDVVSLMLAPMLAACGAFVPMIAGRGLAHTGGTIDKLEAIPGYQTGASVEHFQKAVEAHGFSIVRQTKDLAPADRRMYAMRDVTATVEHLGLITTSIVSKKLAAGLEDLILDVKFGNGAVLQDARDAKALAQSMVDVGNGAGMRTSALMTDMSVPLAWSAGNAVEVKEAAAYLQGDKGRHPRLNEVVLSLGESLLVQCGLYATRPEARMALESVRDNGLALEKWAKGIEAMGGDPKVAEHPEAVLPAAHVVRQVLCPREGFLAGYDVRQVGMAVVELGGGRTVPDAKVDPSVGLTSLPLVGTFFHPGDPMVTIHAATEEDGLRAERRWFNALTWSDEAVQAHGAIGSEILASSPW